MSTILQPFESRNYRLYFGGQCVSLIGSWMTNTATVWLAYHLTGSPVWLGIMAFVSQIPVFFGSPFAGVLADRVNRHRLLIFVQTLSMCQSFTLAFFSLTNRMTIIHLLILGCLQGFINAVDIPVRQSMVIQFIDKKEYLPNAIALNSSVFNMSRLVGPAIAGFVLAACGPGICFLVDGFSFLAVIGALLLMKMTQHVARARGKHPIAEMVDGVKYVYHAFPMRLLLLLMSLFCFFGVPLNVLMPAFARDVFHGDARVLGFLMGSSGFGAMLGAIFLAMRKQIKGITRVITGGGILFGVGMVCFALTHWLPLAMVILSMAGAGGVLIMASINTLLQTLADEDKRGRVMSLFALGFGGMAPLGSLTVGFLAAHIGTMETVILNACIMLLGITIFYRQIPHFRATTRAHIEQQKAAAIQTGLQVNG